MDYELSTEFDLIVVGTGMIESIVSAAASRIGKRVLHVDNNDYYGGAWASFNLDSINKLSSITKTENLSATCDNSLLRENEQLLLLGNDTFNIADVTAEWNLPECAASDAGPSTASQDVGQSESSDAENAAEKDGREEQTEEIAEQEQAVTREHLLKNARKFNIDLAPKLHFARGDFVELLISSNIARYSEFRSVSRVLTWLNGKLEVVPCSRADVFSSTNVSVIEKRMLMKLLTSCVDGDENEFIGYENKTFRTFLKDRKLTDNLVHYVLYAIAMATDDTLCSEGVESTKRFLNSLGRYGKTPFLYSMYGSGEITQAFCRLSAVFGGIYALNQHLGGLIVDGENNFKGLVCNQQRITADHIVMGIEKAPSQFLHSIQKTAISRGIFITDRSILESEKEHLTLLLVPPEDGKNPCIVVEVGSLTGTCLKDLYIVHMFTKQKTNPKDDLQHCVDKLFNNLTMPGGSRSDVMENSSPKILWSFYCTIPDVVTDNLRTDVPKNAFLCPGPELDLDYDSTIKQAKAIFDEMYPETEFLPRAPDPEEIIIEGEDNNNTITDENFPEAGDREAEAAANENAVAQQRNVNEPENLENVREQGDINQ